MKKRIASLLLLITCVFMLLSCKKDIDFSELSNVAPDTERISSEYNLDFNLIHNYVVDSIASKYSEFFFIENGKFDISGDNNKRIIQVTCTCMNGTTVQDLDLFLSLVFQCIGYNTSEQDFRFTAPEVDKTGTYINFGSVFNVYDLVINCDTSNGNILRYDYVKAGTKNPIDSRYWSD